MISLNNGWLLKKIIMVEYDVLWADVARSDLDDIANYIAEEDSFDAAITVVCRLECKAEKLVSMPKRGVVVPELHDIGVLQYRQLTERPWRIIYRIFNSTVYVVAVVDSRRDLPVFLMERLLRF